MKGSPLLIRADVSTEMGTGHVMRCLALAQAWQDAGGEATFVINAPFGGLASRLRQEGVALSSQEHTPGSGPDAHTTATLARRLGCSWVVVDGYHFDSSYQRLLKEAGLKLCLLDDYGHARHYWADVVLNQNPSAREGLYSSREPYTRLLLGTKYALLRREFLQRSPGPRKIAAAARKILITLGGGDPDNITGKVIRALQSLRLADLEAVVVAGGANPHLEELKALVAALPFRSRLEVNVTHMPELMAWADVGITGSGSSCWETAYLGLPCLVIVAADNQRPIAQALEKMGAARVLGWHEDVSPGQIAAELSELLASEAARKSLSRKGQALVDGFGSLRVRELLLLRALS